MMRVTIVLGVLAVLVQPLLAVKHEDFKTCSQAAFCNRGRALSARAAASKSWVSPYSIDSTSVVFSLSKSSLTAAVKSSLYPAIRFELQVHILQDGVARVRMDEVDGLRKRYDEAASWALVTEPALKEEGQVVWSSNGKIGIKAAYDGVELVIAYSPLKITLLRSGREEVVLNGRGLLHMEHFRTKESTEDLQEAAPADAQEEGAGDEQKILQAPIKPNAWFEGPEEHGFWEETFKSWTDSKPKGKSLGTGGIYPIYLSPHNRSRILVARH